MTDNSHDTNSKFQNYIEFNSKISSLPLTQLLKFGLISHK